MWRRNKKKLFKLRVESTCFFHIYVKKLYVVAKKRPHTRFEKKNAIPFLPVSIINAIRWAHIYADRGTKQNIIDFVIIIEYLKW